ncbi:MAG: glycosyltransferase family 39 protein [Bacteroidetes bacterium]|nr:glycosyltransferase family 39 protein [Bacteroidota bacterium]
MKINNEYNQTLPFYLLITGLFLIIISPSLLSKGMFMDGLIYSTIAKNLADGVGTFWNPHFTATCLADFHEHPPLSMGIHSLFYSVFGDIRFIDKIYSLLTFVIVGIIILKIWKRMGYKNNWLPLLIWFSIPLVSWACTNNLLENPLSIFTSLSILFYLKSQDNKKYLCIFVSGLMLSLGFLTKGFVVFFPWTFPFLFWVFLRKKSFGNMFLESLLLVLSSLIPLLLLIIFSAEAKLSLQNYIDIQVIKSLQSATTVDSRFFIVKKLFSELIPAFGICIIVIALSWSKKASISLLKDNFKVALLFFLFGLTGVLPILISMKQSGFYILATFPFFAISIAVLINPFVEFLFRKINFQSKGFVIFRWISIVIFVGGIFLSIFFVNRFDRDKNKISDAYLILSKIPSGSTINISPKMWDDWSLHGYYGRFKNVSLDPNLSSKRTYLLVKNENISDSIVRDYNQIKIQTADYLLFKKN